MKLLGLLFTLLFFGCSFDDGNSPENRINNTGVSQENEVNANTSPQNDENINDRDSIVIDEKINEEIVSDPEANERIMVTITSTNHLTSDENGLTPLGYLIKDNCITCHKSEIPDLLGLIQGQRLSNDQLNKIMSRVLKDDDDPQKMPLGRQLSSSEIELFQEWQQRGYPSLVKKKNEEIDQDTLEIIIKVVGEFTETYSVSGLPFSFSVVPGNYKIEVFENSDVQRKLIFDSNMTILSNRTINLSLTPQPVLSSLDSIISSVKNKSIQSVDQLIDYLPQIRKNNFVLMEESKSRHIASTEFPRMILFGADARLILGISTDPSDHNYNTIEIMEFQENSKQWKLRSIDFEDPSRYRDNDKDCQSCHGSPSRPIWGRYRMWPGAFGNDDDALSLEQSEVLRLAQSSKLGNPRLEKMNIKLSKDSQGRDQMVIQGRRYSYSNTVFNLELGALHSTSLYSRISKHPLFKQLKWYLVGYVANCDIENYETSGQQLAELLGEFPDQASIERLLLTSMGISMENDLMIQLPLFEAQNIYNKDLDDFYVHWFAADNNLIEHIAMHILENELDEHASLKAVFQPLSKTINYLNHIKYRLRGKEREEFIASSEDYFSYNGYNSYIFFRSHREENNYKFQNEICQAIYSE